jgi:hypothetical protein
MTDAVEVEIKEPEVVIDKSKRLVMAGFSQMPVAGGNPWTTKDVDKLESVTVKEFKKVIEACRFFYQKDPLASTVINKLVEIGITDIVFSKSGLSDNELRVFTAIKDKLREFAEDMALEFLVSGLVVPEIKYAAVTKDEIKDLGIKKYPTLTLPVSMWVRDPSTIKINKGFVSSDPSYFAEIPNELISFIMHEGVFPDGTKDKDAYIKLLALYPDFVAEVRAGAREVLLENDLIFRRRVLSNTAYPLAYLYPAIESMKHKRNLRRMDYAVASRVISAIQLITLGSDEFPVTQDDQASFDAIRNQMMWRDTTNQNVERIFQLFANHTTHIEWIMPPTEALLSDSKYKDINQEIIFALGFPRILITGESERTGTSDPQYATMSPVKTMEFFRLKVIRVIRSIVQEVAKQNSFATAPEVRFKPLQLAEFQKFVDSLLNIYSKGDLSRTSMLDYLGYNWKDEFEIRKTEDEEAVPHQADVADQLVPKPVIVPGQPATPKPAPKPK